MEANKSEIPDDLNSQERQIIGDMVALWSICRRRLGVTLIVVAAFVVPNIGGAMSIFGNNNKPPVAAMTKEQGDRILEKLNQLDTGLQAIESKLITHIDAADGKFDDIKLDFVEMRMEFRD